MSTFSQIALLSLSVVTAVQASGYYQFCQATGDGYMEYDGCGIAVATQNDACFQEHGRTYMHLTQPDSTLYYPLLIAYSDDNCQELQGCNSLGIKASGPGSESDINFNAEQAYKYALGANSFRFVPGSPPVCPNDCTGFCGSSKRSRITGVRDGPLPVAAREADNDTLADKRQLGTNFWFCDDDACSVNCGNKIEVRGSGCANGEGARKSVMLTDFSTELQLGAFDNDECGGGPVETIAIREGCTALATSHNSWQVLGMGNGGR